MATPFPHTHVLHVSKKGRRRSKSVTLPDSDEENAAGLSLRRKQFFAQIQMERQKQQNKDDGQHKEQPENHDAQQPDKKDHYQPVVSRVPGASNTPALKKHTSSTTTTPLKKQMSMTTSKTLAAENDEQHQPIVTHVPRTTTTLSMKKHISSTEEISSVLRKEITSISSYSTQSQDNQQHHNHQPQVIRTPRLEPTMSSKKQIIPKTSNNSNVNVFTTYKHSNLDSSATLNGIHLNSSEISTNPLLTSSTNLMSKSEIFDQDFHLDDSNNHPRRNDTKHHGKINISGEDKYYTNYDRKLSAKSSASFMAAIIAIIIGVIAFIFGLTSLVLVLLLRSTIATNLGTNSIASNSLSSSSSSSSGNGSWSSACSAYTTLDDPTRNIFAPGYALGCDSTAPFINRTILVWIRFIGTGGTTLPLTTPGMNICGSESTGWYDGVMPSSGQLVNGTACFTWYTSVCRYSQSISVGNCGSFYIYLLPPVPVCMARYCTL